MEPHAQALSRALALFDNSPTKLANAITSEQRPVRRQHVEHWVKVGRAPADHCPSIERETRALGAPVVCEELRPDIDWSVVRLNKAEPVSTEAADAT